MSPTLVENFRLAAALSYAARGWLVIPLHSPTVTGPASFGGSRCTCKKADCGSVGKHPRTANGLKDGTVDPDTIRGWWKTWPGANVGIVTGAASGIVALDVDPRNGGNEGLAELMDTYGQLPETVEAVTGGGGQHLLYRHPGQVVRSGKGKLGEGLDIKGDGGYIVAAPSLHASGQRYAWRPECSPEQYEVVDLPAWLLVLLVEPKAPHRPSPSRFDSDDGSHWLGKALAKTRDGSRNDTGYWLAQQLRDNGLTRHEAEGVMRDYQARVPQGEKPYTVAEAMQSCDSAYRQPAREPAKGTNPTPYHLPRAAPEPTPAPPPSHGAAAELSAHLDRIGDGLVRNVSLPWDLMTKLTQALLPGSTTVVCGDPGVGKTYFVLEAMQHWHSNGVDAAVFFIEKDRKFHTQRLLAQLESNSNFVDLDWIEKNPAIVSSAMKRHADHVDALGRMIWSAPQERVTLAGLLDWVRQMASAGKRIIVIDPITAASAGAERWNADDNFMLGAEKILNAHGSSMMLVTHSKKGNRPGAPTNHDMALGAAYNRFADTNIWLNKTKKPRPVVVQTRLGGTMKQKLTLFAQLHKTRNGRGGGMELAYVFGGALRFSEQGIVLQEANPSADEATTADPFA